MEIMNSMLMEKPIHLVCISQNEFEIRLKSYLLCRVIILILNHWPYGSSDLIRNAYNVYYRTKLKYFAKFASKFVLNINSSQVSASKSFKQFHFHHNLSVLKNFLAFNPILLMEIFRYWLVTNPIFMVTKF